MSRTGDNVMSRANNMTNQMPHITERKAFDSLSMQPFMDAFHSMHGQRIRTFSWRPVSRPSTEDRPIPAYWSNG